ncbi:MAG: hypothetical protein U5N26_06020 [Candidatus Marinimicrobia bacterium]|nr:hypothetical protein [Candidatus Neomarinimicrobiota bacterium]
MLCLVLLSLLLPASERKPGTVYFSPETPYLPEISEILVAHRYVLSTDSSSAEYRGELFFYREEDSLRCEIELRDTKDVAFILDTFMKEPAETANVRRSLRNFSICLLILNAITSIFFFVRTS